MRARITQASQRVFNAVGFHTHRENMFAIVARRFGYIETQKVLAFQILLDGLKYRSEIGRRGSQCCLDVADEEVLPASFLSQFAKALARASYGEMSVARLEKRQMDHVKRDATLEC